MSDAYKTLGRILSEETNSPLVTLAPHSQLNDLPGWSSATLIGVILAIEEGFGVFITREQLGQIVTAADLAQQCEALPG